MTIEFEVHQQAEELYILDGLTLGQVAEKTGIPESTVKRWSTEGQWVEKRQEYRRAQGEIKRNTVLYRLKLLENAMTSLHAQDAFAWSSVEKTAADKILKDVAAPKPVRREIRTAQDAVDALDEAIRIKLHTILATPGSLNLGQLKDLKQAMGLLDEMRAKYGTAADTVEAAAVEQGLNEEQADFWRRKVLGII